MKALEGEKFHEPQALEVVTYVTESDPVEGLKAAWKACEKLYHDGVAQEGAQVVMEVIPLGNIAGDILYTIKATQKTVEEETEC